MKLESWGYVFPLLTRRPPVRPPETRFLRHETRRTRQSRQALPPAHAGTVPSQGTDTRSGASREPTTTVYAFDYGVRSRRTRLLGDQLWLAGNGSWQIADRYATAS